MFVRFALRNKSMGLTAVTVAVALVLAPVSSALAQENRGPPTLRDTETEQLLRDYTRPILRAAGLEKQNIQPVIINNGTFNAFVADGRRIFVNYGAILQSETPNQLIGVLAHETGHLAGGHLAKLREQLARAQTQMIIAMLLGAGAMVAGARSGNADNGLASAGAAAVAGPQEMVRRSLLSYQRQQEETPTGPASSFSPRPVNPRRACTTPSSASPAKACLRRAGRTPICSRTRCRPSASPRSRNWPAPAPTGTRRTIRPCRLRHDMIRAKISAFMERQDTVYRRYPLSNDSAPARYARAITTYLHGDLRSALTQIDALIQQQPANPYFYELRGQALLEGARPAEAIAPLRRAVQLSNNAPLIEMLLGQALVATENKAYTDEAVTILRAAVARESEAPLGFTQLAMAYGRKGDYAEADLASAQAAFLRGDNKTARELASRAKTRFAIGTPGWVKADDIVSAKPLPGSNN